MEKEVIKLFVNTSWQILEKKEDKYILVMEVETNEDNILISMATLSSFFQEQVINAAKKKWSEKKVFISYKSDVKLDYYSFREFKKKVFDT